GRVLSQALIGTLSHAGALSCRGYLVHRSGPYSAGRQFRALSVSAGMLRRSVIFVDSTRLIVKSYQHHGKNVYTGGGIGAGMWQSDSVSGIEPASRESGPKSFLAPVGSGLLAAGSAVRPIEEIAAALPDFVIARRFADLARTQVAGVVRWDDLRHE